MLKIKYEGERYKLNRTKIEDLKKILFSIWMLFLGVSDLFPQYGSYFGSVRNLVHSDNKLYHFGFILGFNTMDFDVTNSGVTDASGKIWFADQTSLLPGFTVGIVSDLRIFSWLNLRFTPVLLFGDRKLTFIDQERESKKDVIVKSSLIDFPLGFKIRGQRFGNYRPYLLIGGNATIDLTRQRENEIMLKAPDYGIEFGLGVDFYLPYFKLAPELKMFIGLSDMIERDRPEIINASDLKYTDAITKLTSRLFVLSFNFE